MLANQELFYVHTEVNKPMYPVYILKKTQPNRVYRRVAPAFVEESTCSVEVVEVLVICTTSPKIHVSDLEV